MSGTGIDDLICWQAATSKMNPRNAMNFNFCGAELLLFDINKFDTRSDFSRNYIEFDMRDFDTDKEYLKLEYLSLANSMTNESDLHKFLKKCNCLRTLNLVMLTHLQTKRL